MLFRSNWLKEVDRVVVTADAEHRWLTHDLQRELISQKDALGIDTAKLKALFDSPVIQASMGDNKPRVQARLAQWSQNWPEHWKTRNQAHMIRDLDACSHLLDNVESRALNDEQAKAVVCFDNRVQLIASAGQARPQQWSPRRLMQCTAASWRLLKSSCWLSTKMQHRNWKRGALNR
ncbi:hypothetical protein [Pseudomonas typographi]|uniref:hypothetical protein n=1 Tax=Pseudomonas typographi TaxID=2715964 RepID=UPI001EEEEDF0|nr:hypothetical protein [Pseudomonas typographi]